MAVSTLKASTVTALKIVKHGATVVVSATGRTFGHISDGHYRLSLLSGDVATRGHLRAYVRATGASVKALPFWRDFDVIPATVYDSLVSGTTKLNVGTLSSGLVVWSVAARTLTSGLTVANSVWAGGTRTLTSGAVVWTAATRTLTSGSAIAGSVWVSSTRTLTSAGTTWSAAARTLTSGLTIGNSVWVSATRTLTSAGAAWSAGARTLTSGLVVWAVAARTLTSGLTVANSVWAGTTRTLTSAGSTWSAGARTLTSGAVVWVGTTPRKLTATGIAGVVSGVWKVAVPGSYASGTAGYRVGTFIDAPISGIVAGTGGGGGSSASTIWAYATRTLTSGATVRASVWGATGTRTLTSGGTVWVAAGRTLTSAGTTWTAGSRTLTATGVTAIAAAVPTAIQNADALLNRDMSAVSDTNSRSPLNALRFLRNKWTLATNGTLTVKEEDDTTNAWTASVSTATGASPVVGVDPA
jgi:hypothetical protein